MELLEKHIRAKDILPGIEQGLQHAAENMLRRGIDTVVAVTELSEETVLQLAKTVHREI